MMMQTIYGSMFPRISARQKKSSMRSSFGLRNLGLVAILILSASFSPSICNAFGTSVAVSKSPKTTSNQLEIRLVNLADPKEVQSLQDCRRTAFDPNKQNWLNSEKSFCAAQSVIDEKHLCAVALDKKTRQVVGSADLYPTERGENTILNVFVRPDLRGKGIGRQLMVEGIEQVLVPLLKEPNRSDQEAILSLDVYTQNKAAIELYLKLGYEPASPMHTGTLKLAKVLNSNLVVKLAKTVPVV